MDEQPFLPQAIAVLTVSDTRRSIDDRSGDLLAGRLAEAGHRLSARRIVGDDVPAIQAALREFIADPVVDVVISTGGTGFTGRDVTPEAAEPLFGERMDGFSFLFHQASFAKIGTTTLLSRATAGIANATIIFCLPGSPGACRDAWDAIIGPQLDSRTKPHNLVLVKPRMNEHRG